jgi:hypothetical protein
MRGLRLFASSVQREKPLGCLTRSFLRESTKASSQSLTAAMSGLAKSGLRHSARRLNSTIVKIVVVLLLTIGVVDASAKQQLEFLEGVRPQRPGMKTEEDYQRFVQEHGLPQRSEPTPEDLDRLRSQSQRELKLEQEYSRRNSSSANSSSVSQMSDDEILNAIRLDLDGSYEPPSVDASEDWPKSPEEFEKKYGRPPQRREEVDFYFGDDDGISQEDECPNR